LTAKLEVAKKALAEERAARQIVDQSLAEERVAQLITDQSLQASQEANVALTQDLQSTQAFVIATREKLSSKSTALDESVIRECKAQIKLQTLEDEKKAKEQLMESTQMMLSKRDFTSSVVSSLAVAHAMALVKSHMPNFDAELFLRDFPINDEEWDALVDSVYDTAQYFVSQYDFDVLVELDDNASPRACTL
jgi:hypothetical protein